MKKTKMTIELLNLLIMVQNYKIFLDSQRMFNDKLGIESDYFTRDSHIGTHAFYIGIDSNILDKFNLSHNKISFEKVLYFVVTDEMENTEYCDLDKFEF